MSENKITFSVIIASFNENKNIQFCIDSFENQTYQRKELIVIDGGSTDGTADIIRLNSNKISYWESEPDKGVYHAWNKAIDQVKGNWVYFLGSDDYFKTPFVLDRVASEIKNKHLYDCDLICGSVEMVGDEKNQIIVPDIKKFPNKMLPHQGIFHSSRMFEQGYRFSDEFSIRGDYEFLVRIFSQRQLKMHQLDEIIAVCKTGGLSSAANVRMKIFHETFTVRKLYSLKPYSKEMILFWLKSVIKQSGYKLGW